MQSYEARLTEVSDFFGKEITEALDREFGVDFIRGSTAKASRVGYILVLATRGEGGNMTLKTNLRREGLKQVFKELSDKLQGGKGVERGR